MRKDTIRRKNATKAFRQVSEDDWVRDQMFRVMVEVKRAFDEVLMEMGKMLAETIFYMEREEKSGPDHFPIDSNVQKWADILNQNTSGRTVPAA